MAETITVKFASDLRPDDEIAKVRISQGGSELRLTQPQAVSLMNELKRKFGGQ